MDSTELREILRETRSIASDAARLVLAGHRRGVDVKKKGTIDLVTEFDLASEALIRARLAQAFPGHDVVGEEGDHRAGTEYVWFVDPLDGTTNFAHGHLFFCVSIGLVRVTAAGTEPLVGVVAAPALGLTWSGARGLGAFRNDEPCRVTSTTSLQDALVATGFAYDQSTDDDNVPEMRAFLKRTRGIRRCGAAAIDLALTADGTYDLYWEQRLNPWDLSAGALLVLEAGGRLSDYDGGPFDVRAGRIVASNGSIHDAALEVLSEVRG